MASTIIMPQLGETVAEGKILTWFKSVGDEILEGDNLFEVETDKVTVEVQAIVAGRLSEIRIGPGLVAKVGDVVATVGGEAAKAAVQAPAQSISAAHVRSPLDEVVTPEGGFGPAKGPNGLRLSPLARRLIVQHGLDAASLAAEAARRGETKIGGKAVRAAIAATSLAPRADAAGTVVTLNSVRQRTAERLAESWRAIPHVFQGIEVDFTAIDCVREASRATVSKTHGVSLTYLPFVARAVCLAIDAFPRVNSRFDGKALKMFSEVHLGVAVDLDHNGLVVPVVHDAGDLSLIGLAKAIRRKVEKSRAGRLSLDDLANGTYSISNNGSFGTSFTAPIINAPEVAILSIDAVRLKPAVVSTAEGDFIAPRKIGIVGQSFDHRAFDGAYSAAFLSRLKQILETRNWAEEISATL
jgi:pyruvate/2-oxoglutarate dehydrogenase complex dihydrolipoamide acyltransferase (E2) component